MARHDDKLDLAAPRRTRMAIAVGVVLLQVGLVLGLIRAFAPDFAASAVNTVVSTFTVTITAPPPPPEPAPSPEPAGASGEAGKKAVARETKAPKPKVDIAKTPAPRASSTGSANTSGATSQGSGTGAGGPGDGTGSGNGGAGSGGGLAAKAVHVSGQINNARDFPVPEGGREARVGKSVVLALTIGTDGRASACRIFRSSGFPDTDAVACRLAQDRLRFKPATNAAGDPVVSTFYWQQKFYF